MEILTGKSSSVLHLTVIFLLFLFLGWGLRRIAHWQGWSIEKKILDTRDYLYRYSFLLSIVLFCIGLAVLFLPVSLTSRVFGYFIPLLCFALGLACLEGIVFFFAFSFSRKKPLVKGLLSDSPRQILGWNLLFYWGSMMLLSYPLSFLSQVIVDLF